MDRLNSEDIEIKMVAHRGISTATQSLAKQLCPVLKENRTPEVVSVMIVITVLALASVIFRVVSRKIGHVKFWWDDYLILFVMVSFRFLSQLGLLNDMILVCQLR